MAPFGPGGNLQKLSGRSLGIQELSLRSIVERYNIGTAVRIHSAITYEPPIGVPSEAHDSGSSRCRFASLRPEVQDFGISWVRFAVQASGLFVGLKIC